MRGQFDRHLYCCTEEDLPRILREAVRTGEGVSIEEHTAHCRNVLSTATKLKEEILARSSSRLIDSLPASPAPYPPSASLGAVGLGG